MGEENATTRKWIIFSVVLLLLSVGLSLWIEQSGEAKVKATLKVNAEELEGIGTRYVHLSVFVKNNTDSPIEIDELRYFTKLLI